MKQPKGRKFGILTVVTKVQLEEELALAVQNVELAVDRAAQSLKRLQKFNNSIGSKVMTEDDIKRAKVIYEVNKIVRANSVTNHRATFVELYHEYYKQTGVHPVVASGIEGLKTHLDVVQREGGLDRLLEIAKSKTPQLQPA